ncbi:hypothetical protein Pse7367_3674 (plasmid) [Thalassoporum mexicanum PCC 7367]|uniref:DUF6220 domain-containing protein n=1 Tax=Thalassoporum mexicanum TaxID=3457544 RepID=UPI00029F9412|nr:DUF6220 domain-containing protein [Pseudanabaena sp. PCC 7367]AFY71907.1 hypothetical protein Pse7367_3674 [Pseudanabaena sp. PCC 7367]
MFLLTIQPPVNLADAIADTPAPTTDDQPPSPSAVIGFYGIAIGFNLCLGLQLLTVGLAYFYNPSWWQIHVLLVRGYGCLALILVVWAYLVRLPKRLQLLSLSLPILLGLQFLTIHLQTPLPVPLAILHPLLGFTLFFCSATLVHRTAQYRKHTLSLS